MEEVEEENEINSEEDKLSIYGSAAIKKKKSMDISRHFSS